ncbi:PepSY-associated TM helix domain-containing protein [Dyadobacter frigoris]|uniref:PepSY domain-containing protein n=1 Tax=Dyadobacter frigoris TaxID=2576211 RepID=A0A4U6CZL0_9BACT|nr:PepSY-associated TM helix domain-containing protein [Dyadobacter frigoris]TKT90320.1 PepSY domain-containing protein [Dyadobacter frigoris]
MTTFKKVNNWLHLWLGLISGIIVFIVCITGCIWVFNEEIEGLLEPETKIERKDKAVIMPSQLMKIAKASYPDIKVSYANYQQGRAINLGLGERRGPNITLKVNPYTGEIITKEVHKKGETNFFRWVLNGHRFLWLPFEIGRPIVNYGTLVFVILLITGLVWWYPKKWTKSTTDKSFKIKWGASFKRVNLDLHNVLGFYSLLFLLAIAMTGMVYGIKWYSQSLYWATSGGKSLPGREREILSDSLMAGKLYTPQQAIDKAWLKVISENPEAEGFYYNFPDTSKAKSSIYVTIYPNSGQFYNNRSYSFDQHTLKELPKDEVYGATYDGAPFGTKLRKMNYDIHVGSILGFPGKVLAFLSSLIGASLPVTGFLVWWGRKGFGKKGRKDAKKEQKSQSKNLAEKQENTVSAARPKFKPGVVRKSDVSEKHTIDSSSI